MTEKFEIENDYLRLEVASVGAEAKSLYSKLWQRELLWTNKEEELNPTWSRTAPILFPIVGKLKNNTYSFQGKNYFMSQHGFARDSVFSCIKRSSFELEFCLVADQKTFIQYPFCFKLSVNYTLEGNSLIMNYLVENDDRQDIYFSIGAHPAFQTEKIDEYIISFEQKEDGYFLIKDGLVNWRDQYPLLDKSIAPTKDLFKNDALIFKEFKSSYIDLINTKKNQVVRLTNTNTPYLGLWAKNEVPFVCIEPWFGVSDSESHDNQFENKKGIQKLAVGKKFNFSYSIELLEIKVMQ